MRKPANVLVVDSNPGLLNAFALILKRKGYKVEMAQDGTTALVKFITQRHNVVVMDAIMPDIDSIETFRWMRHIDSEAKLILMAAYHEQKQISQAHIEDVFNVIHKPVAIAKLVSLINETTLSNVSKALVP